MNDNWYVATLIFASRIEGREGRLRTVDEQIRILSASDIEAAYEKAVEIGKREEHSYANVYGKTVQWEFIGLADLEEMFDTEPGDGAEIKYRLLRKRDPSKLVLPKDELTVFQWERDRRRRQALGLVKKDSEP